MFDILDGTEIAIVGMAGRFPRAGNIDQFWRNLCHGAEAITFFDENELRARGVDSALLDDPNFVKAAAVIDDMELFDNEFFGFTPKEAEIMDPQHRLLLETAWEALEHAGYNPLTYQGAIGIFAGATINTYLLVNLSPRRALIQSLEDVQINIANGGDFLTTRISYKLNLKGPSHLVQSACSTSLVAVHLACQSLLSEESDMVLAGGVSVNPKLRYGYRYVEGGIVSPDGRCRAFDSRAQGTIFGSGVGLVVLKRLTDAFVDGDNIQALIKGSAINNDGSLKIGYTAPSVEGQAQVIAEALSNAGVSSETISYVEAHGTGTPLGDPVEVQALTKAFRVSADRKGFCALGSVKTNVGHLDAAAGVTGLIKTALALKHKVLPPSLHYEQPNPQIDFGNSPFYVNSALRDWASDGAPRRAGVSAFGVGGTNAHVILEEAPPPRESGAARPWQLILLSGKTNSAASRVTANLAAFLEQNRDCNLADVAYTLQVGRPAFSYRQTVVCRDVEGATESLKKLSRQPVISKVHRDEQKPVAFLFPGQGAQHVNMGLEIYRHEPIFKAEVDSCVEIIKAALGIDLLDVIYPSDKDAAQASHQLAQTSLTQPALFVIEYALARLWMSWGVKPAAMLGHSIGEYVAACLAQVMTLEDALNLVVARGQLMQELPAGGMLSVGLPDEEVRCRLSKELSLASINGPAQCVVSGPLRAIEKIEEQLVEEGISCRRLQTSHAFHSEMVEPILAAFAHLVSAIKLQPPQIPYVSNVTGTWIAPAEATSADYWARHLRQAVRFADGIDALLATQGLALLEVGPGQTLSRITRRQLASQDERLVLATLRRPDQSQDDWECLLTTLGQLWRAGFSIDWQDFSASQKRMRVALPTYPFERNRCWIDPPSQQTTDALPEMKKGKRAEIEDWFYIPSWKRTLAPPLLQAGELEAGRRWLIMEDRCGLGEALSAELQERAAEVIRVRVGERYRRVGDRLYEIAPARQEDYEELLGDLDRTGYRPDVIAHLWSVTEQAEVVIEDGRRRERFEEIQRTGCYSLLFLTRALENRAANHSLRLMVVSNELHQIASDATAQPAKATLLGVCRVIPQEYPNLSCRSLDVTIHGSNPDRFDNVVARLLAEMKTETDEMVVSYRGSQRWSQTYEPSPPPARTEAAGEPTPLLSQRGCYLLTGGLQRVGLAFARHLAQEVSAKLVLVEEPPFPSKEDWEAWLASHHPDDEISRKITNAQNLERDGAEVLVIKTELSDVGGLQSAVRQAIDRFGALCGVIHAAGVSDERMFRAVGETGVEECQWHFTPKAHALFALDSALSDLPLDFCLLNSSLSSVLGGVGYVAYAAANLFLDAFVQQRNRTHRAPWLSINWDAWRFDEEERRLVSVNEDLADLALTPAEGIEVFRRLLSARVSDQIIVSTGDLQQRRNRWAKSQPLHLRAEEGQTNRRSAMRPRPELPVPYVAPSSELERAIIDVWQDVLDIEQIGAEDNFFDLGADSLLAVQVAAQLRRALKTPIPTISLYEGLTAKSLAVLLRAQTGMIESSAPDETRFDEREQRVVRRKEYRQKQRSRRKESAG